MPALNHRHKEIQWLGFNLYFLLSVVTVISLAILFVSNFGNKAVVFFFPGILIGIVVAVYSFKYNGKLYLINFIFDTRLKDSSRRTRWQGDTDIDERAL